MRFRFTRRTSQAKTREDWIAAVRARTDHYLATGDPAPILDAEAGREAHQITLALRPDTPGGPDVDGMRTLADLRWYIHQVRMRNGETAEPEFDVALSHYAVLEPVAPWYVPNDARLLLDGNIGVAPQDAMHRARQAIQLGDRARLDAAVATLFCAHAVAGRDPQLQNTLGIALAEALLARDAPGDRQRATARLRWLEGPAARTLLDDAERRGGGRPAPPPGQVVPVERFTMGPGGLTRSGPTESFDLGSLDPEVRAHLTMTSAHLGGRELDILVRTRAEGAVSAAMRAETVGRALAPGLWETISMSNAMGVQSLNRDRTVAVDEDALFRQAIGNAVELPFTLESFEAEGLPVLEIEGTHEFVPAHVHVLSRYLDAPFTDGALVCFPRPTLMVVHRIGRPAPEIALEVLQRTCAEFASGPDGLSGQIYWWRPSPRELAAPGRDVEPGHRPDLRPVRSTVRDRRITVSGDPEFQAMCGRSTSPAADVGPDPATKAAIEADLRRRGAIGPGEPGPQWVPMHSDGPGAVAGFTIGPPAELLRLRLHGPETSPDVGAVPRISRPLAPGLLEFVALDAPCGTMLVPQGPGLDEPQMFRDAVTSTVEEPFTLDRIDDGPVPLLHIGGTHEYMAAHAHVLTRYLDAPFTDGAIVAFPVPQVVLVHQIRDHHPFAAAAMVQEIARHYVAKGDQPISAQAFWWRPTARELAAAGRDVEVGHRPDLRPISVVHTAGGVQVQGDDDFRLLGVRLDHLWRRA
jgi:hypothetical protein